MDDLERFTDTSYAKSIFQKHLPLFSGGELLIHECRILRTRLKTYLKEKSRYKSFISACYQLEIIETGTRNRHEQLLYAKAFLNGRSLIELQNLKKGRLSSQNRIKMPVHLPELDLLIWTFPEDPELPHLPGVIDPQMCKQYFPYGQFPDGLDAPQNISEVEIKVVHYYPEQRCTSRYHLRWGPQEKAHTYTMFGKTFKDDSGVHVYRRMKRLWREIHGKPDGFIIARPLGYNAEAKTVWVEAVSGESFGSHLNRTNATRLLTAAARALARLHQSDLTSPVKIDLCELQAELRKKAGKLSRAFPALEEPVERIARDLMENTCSLPPGPVNLIHGDFHLCQLLVHEGKIALFDFDEFAMGDPAQDLASFLVDMSLYDFDPGLLQTMARTFFSAYRASVPWEIHLERLRWYLCFQLITKAYRVLAYRLENDDREQKLRRLVEMAEKIEASAIWPLREK